MNNKQLRITAILLFIFFVIATTPASIVYALASPIKGLEVSTIEGSLWSGKAGNVQYNGINFGNTTWHISPLSLFLLELSGDVHSKSSNSKVDANFSVSMSSFDSDSIKARFPANWLPKLTASNFQTDGKILLRIIHLHQAKATPIDITGTIAWQQASLKTPFGGKATLGDLQIDIASEKQLLLFNLRNNQGPMGLDAKITFTPPNKILARGSVNENLPIELSNFFRFFAKPNNKGKLVFDYNTVVPGL